MYSKIRVSGAALESHNLLHFRLNSLKRTYRLIITIHEDNRDEKLQKEQSSNKNNCIIIK